MKSRELLKCEKKAQRELSPEAFRSREVFIAIHFEVAFEVSDGTDGLFAATNYFTLTFVHSNVSPWIVHDVFDHVFQHRVAREYWVHLGTAVFRLHAKEKKAKFLTTISPQIKPFPVTSNRAHIRGLYLKSFSKFSCKILKRSLKVSGFLSNLSSTPERISEGSQ